MSEDRIKEAFAEYIEENPYDFSYAMEQFQTEEEYITADLKYRDKREENCFEEGYLQGISELQEKLNERDEMIKQLKVARKGWDEFSDYIQKKLPVTSLGKYYWDVARDMIDSLDDENSDLTHALNIAKLQLDEQGK